MRPKLVICHDNSVTNITPKHKQPPLQSSCIRMGEYMKIDHIRSPRRAASGEMAEGLTHEDMLAGLAAGSSLTLSHFMQIIQQRGNKSAGAIRVSLGLASNFADVYRFWQFANTFRDRTNLSLGQVTFHIESCRQIRNSS